MPSFLNRTWQRMIYLWGQSSLAQRILMSGLVVSIIIAFIVLMMYINTTNYKVLYSKLSPKDASRIKKVLEKQKVDYKLKNGGTTIMVPAGQVHSLRLTVAGKDIVHGQGVGFELFDKTKIGQTEFVQHVNYQRALQGELARTISDYPAVQSARVHLVIPEKTVFIEEQEPPSSSVVLNLKGGRELKEEQVQSIVNLVAAGVKGMNKEHITVSNTRGQVLYEPDKKSVAGLSNSQLEYQRNVENNLEGRIEDILRPIVGGNGVIAKVNAELNFNRKKVHKVQYDPDSAVVRSEKKTSESSTGTAAQGGSPEPQYQGEEGGGTQTTQETNRRTSTTNFEINKEEQNIVSGVGNLEELSVAVLVDGNYVKNEEGNYKYEPLGEETLARVKDLAQKAVGFDKARGDSIEVSNMAFGAPKKAPQPTFMDNMSKYFDVVGKPLLNTLLVLLFLLLVVRPIVMAILRPKVSEGEGETGGEGLPEGEERMALAEGATEEEMEGMDASKRMQSVRETASQLVEENFDQAYSVVKKWMREEGS